MNKGFLISKLNLLLVLIFSLAGVQCLSQASTAQQNSSQPFSINESPLGAPTSPVMDYAGVIDAGTKQSLEQKIIQFRDRTNPRVELAVAIVKTTGERPIFEYSLAVARGWGIGSKEDDNPSALLFIAIDDRKYFTQVSKDLQDELPDGLAGQLQRQHLVPAFKQGNYSKGVADTIEAYIRTIETRGAGVSEQPVGGGGVTNQNRKAGRNGLGSIGGGCSTVVCLLILFVIIVMVFSRFGSSRSYGGGGSGGYGRRRRSSNWGGGGFGGSAVPWILGSIIANSINTRGSSGDWGGGGSGGWSSGGGGGGDSWGGFGGGGDFDGGGAGGDW